MAFSLKTESATPKAHSRHFSCRSKNAYRVSRVENPGLRFYSANLSRWISRDPIGEEGGEHPYTFVWNGPMNWMDYIGLVGIQKRVHFVYKGLSGQFQPLTATTKAEDIQVEYDWTGGDGGYTEFKYHNAAVKEGSHDICSVWTRLRIRMNKAHQGKGDMYKDPSVPASVYYRRHVTSTKGEGGKLEVKLQKASVKVVPTTVLADLLAFHMRTHERGHARGMIELLFKHSFGEHVEEAADWEKIVPLVAAGNHAEAGKVFEDALTDVLIRDDIATVHMKAADDASIGALHGRAKWTESDKPDLKQADLQWTFTP